MNELLGLWIPREYLINDLLTGNERLVVSCVLFRSENGVYKGTIREISTLIGLRENKVSEAVSDLIKKGFIIRNEFRNLSICHDWRYPEMGYIEKPKKVSRNGIVSQYESIPKQDRKYSETGDNSIPKQDTIPYIEKHSLKHDNNNGAKGEEIIIIDSEKKESFKHKKGKVFKLAEVTFLESELADFNVFEEFLKTNHPDLDTNYYYHKISTWLDKDTGQPPKRKVWKTTVKIFLENDYKRAELVTTTKQKSQNGKSTTTQPDLFGSGKAAELDNLIDQYFASR